MHVAVNALFLQRPHTGSGQYAQHLLDGLRAVEPALRLSLIDGPLMPHADQRGEDLAKLVWEQGVFAMRAARIGADILHVPYWAPPLFSPIPVVATIHDVIPALLPEYRGGHLVAAYTRLVGIAARRARRLIVDSECSKRDLVRVVGVPADRVDVAPLAASALFRPIDQAAATAYCRDRWGLERPFFLYVGGNDVRKNVSALLRAWSAASRKLPRHDLVIAGNMRREPPFFPDVPGLAADLGLVRIRFLGAVSDAEKHQLLGGCTAFVWPSRYEGFGLPPLEAMQTGAPVISSDRSAMPEVVGEAGILVSPDNVAAIADALLLLAGDAALRERLRAAGLAQAARFSWQRTAELTIASYERALG